MAYKSLGHSESVSDPLVQKVAEKYGASPAQVLLRWSVEQGIAVIPSSTRLYRLHEFAGIWAFQLSRQDVQMLTMPMDRHTKLIPPDALTIK